MDRKNIIQEILYVMEEFEDYKLYIEAESRLQDTNCKTYTHDEICNMYGITDDDLANIDVDIDIDVKPCFTNYNTNLTNLLNYKPA